MNQDELKAQCLKVADQYRRMRMHADGFVVLTPKYYSETDTITVKWVGWINELRDPNHCLPGMIAVSPEGELYQATGEGEYNGARSWESMEEKPA